MTTRDKLTFVHSMARATRATVRQCAALMRYSHTLSVLNVFHTNEAIAKRDRIQRKVTELCHDISELDHNRPEGVRAVFAGPVLKIRTPGGEEIVCPS